jgi:hypothetical protein
MTTHQEHFGRKFYQDKKTGYWISTQCPKIRAHRWVWLSTYGNIPPGYHIHHKNGNKSDNNIKNLEVIESSRHASHHYTDEKKKWASKWVEQIRPMTKAWHSSEEGKEWHSFHAIKCNFGKGNPIKYICQCCSKEYESVKRSRALFCSNACKSQWRRDQGIDDIEKECPICNIKFTSNKYAKNIYCSRECSSKSRILCHK